MKHVVSHVVLTSLKHASTGQSLDSGNETNRFENINFSETTTYSADIHM